MRKYTSNLSWTNQSPGCLLDTGCGVITGASCWNCTDYRVITTSPLFQGLPSGLSNEVGFSIFFSVIFHGKCLVLCI